MQKVTLTYNNLKYFRNQILLNDPKKIKEFSQRAIGVAIGRTRAMYNWYENNKRQPNNEVANRIVKYFQKALPEIRKEDLFKVKPFNT